MPNITHEALIERGFADSGVGQYYHTKEDIYLRKTEDGWVATNFYGDKVKGFTTLADLDNLIKLFV